jgi:hypothetical protein
MARRCRPRSLRRRAVAVRGGDDGPAAGPCLQAGILADMLQGREPRELIREYYRLRRRARDLTGSTAAGAGSTPFDAGHAAAFLDWYAARHDDVPEGASEATGTILAEWGPHENLDERSFYACSPHRIEMAAHLIREGYFADYANAALGLLPEWTEWCIEQSRLDGAAAARPANRPAPRLQFSLTMRLTSQPPRTTTHCSAAMSELPGRVQTRADSDPTAGRQSALEPSRC